MTENKTPAAGARTSVYQLSDANVTVHELGDPDSASTFLVLHGGAGPHSMLGIAGLLAADRQARVIVPTHPGFAGTPRPAELTGVPALAALYAELLERLDAKNVTVIGNSLGGWAATELALLGTPRVTAVILANAIGIDVPGEPITDVSTLTPAQLAAKSFHDPARFQPDPSRPGPDLASLAAYTKMSMTDPGLRDRLKVLDLPVHVIWGASDEIATPGYGRAFAEAIPGARFTLLEGAGHLPQLEAPQRLLAEI